MGPWPSQRWLSVLELEASPALSMAEQGDQPQAVNLLCSKGRAKGPGALSLWSRLCLAQSWADGAAWKGQECSGAQTEAGRWV